MVSGWGSEHEGWWERAVPLKTSAQLKQMAHLLMAHLGKSHGQAPTSRMKMSRGKTGKEEKGMDNCEQMIWSPPHEVGTVLTLSVENKIEAQRDWVPCPRTYSYLMIEPRFDPRESDSMVLHHFLDSSFGSFHFCGSNWIILSKFSAGFNENSFSRRLKYGNNNALWNDVMDFFKK